MAEAASSQDLRCSKCRSSLGVNPDQVHDLEGQSLDQTLIFLREDKLPEWIEQKVEEVKTLLIQLWLLLNNFKYVLSNSVHICML